MQPFYSYEEIPALTKDYILGVAEAKSVEEIPLEDINSFLLGLEEYYNEQATLASEWEDGWVL